MLEDTLGLKIYNTAQFNLVHCFKMRDSQFTVSDACEVEVGLGKESKSDLYLPK